ncbi:MAG: hypothetical protein GX374_07975 [Bacilli bacterium]|nr:hypothetical protein [Bacilli bacterium]
MSQRILKQLLSNILYEIEHNEHLTIDEVIRKMSIEMQSHLFMNERKR